MTFRAVAALEDDEIENGWGPPIQEFPIFGWNLTAEDAVVFIHEHKTSSVRRYIVLVKDFNPVAPEGVVG